MGLFTELNADPSITIVVVTHEPDIAQFAKRLVRFVDGRVEADGPAARLLAQAVLQGGQRP